VQGADHVGAPAAAELGHPELDVDKWHALENCFFDFLDSADDLG
jgi:hypothetical protein